MASAAEDPIDAAFIEDEDLLDDDDDDDSSGDQPQNDDVDADDDSASSSPAATTTIAVGHPVAPPQPQVSVAVPGHGHSDPHLRPPPHLSASSPAAVTPITVRQPIPIPDEARKLFQRLWTDEDEIELLQGFLDYTAQRGIHGSAHHHDTTAFYDQIKGKFQLEFNKNQLVEKLRRLKKKYRNVIQKIESGKEYAFKSAHEQATFEISCKIWGNGVIGGGVIGGINGSVVRTVIADDNTAGGFDDDELRNPNFADNQSPNPNSSNGIDVNSNNKLTPRPRKRNKTGAVKIEEQKLLNVPDVGANVNNVVTPSVSLGASAPVATPLGPSISNVIEETVKSCLSPLFKELLGNSMNMNAGGGMYGGRQLLGLSQMPFGFGGGMIGGEAPASDEKWRKQQILELEVFSKRLELVQDQIKLQLEELRSMGS